MSANGQLTFFATSPKGIDNLLIDELAAIGADNPRPARGGAYFEGDITTAYRVCLWTRLANRVVLQLKSGPVATPDDLYELVKEIPWHEHMRSDGSMAVLFNGSGSGIRHSRFGLLRVKDAIVDQFREATGHRPDIDTDNPDIRVSAYLHKERASIGVDLSGESLHRRNYRSENVAAPLKENLAAAMLYRAGWPELAAAGKPLLDPMCGSGTLPIEGALMAADIAPGLLRMSHGFESWLQHDKAVWSRLIVEAEERREQGLKKLPVIVGYDADRTAVNQALASADRAGLAGRIHFERRDLADLQPLAEKQGAPGLVAVNPPYGVRLGERHAVRQLYAFLGARIKENFAHWRMVMLAGDAELGKASGLRAHKVNQLFNGPLECALLQIEVPEPLPSQQSSPQTVVAEIPLTEGARSFSNRLQKNLKHLARWVRREEVSCYRLYDADIPEYSVAVDRYGDWVQVQEYAPPKTVDAVASARRLQEVMAVVPQVLGCDPEKVVLKHRERQRGSGQYEKLSDEKRFFEVQENGLRFLVNLHDYLDTGLFLDHRMTRVMVRELAKRRRFLNLFAYTGSATVYAAAGGASHTTTVDMSKTYIDWAKRNLALNGFGESRHQFIQEDCLQWFKYAKGQFDLIFLDPPTFSNSKRMGDSFDVQRDHVDLLEKTLRLLAPDGVLIFSNNRRNFKMDHEAVARLGLMVETLSKVTLPPDFSRNPQIHNCWKITRQS